jgi:L-iditol 2-dehydrogenase
VPAENTVDLLVLPEGMPFEQASLVEPLACCVKAFRRTGLAPGECVLVIGLGSMGQLLAALARALGGGPVIGTDFIAFRRERALAHGCDAVLDAAEPDLAAALRAVNGGRLADLVLVGPGDARAMEAGLALTAPGGRWCCFWPLPPEERLPVSTFDLYFNEVTLHFSYSCGPDDTAEALHWLARGLVRSEDLVTHRFPLAEAHRAFDVTRQPGDSLKAVVVVDGTAR